MGVTRKLYRSKTNRQLAGRVVVWPSTPTSTAPLIRVLFVVLTVLGGSGLVPSVAMWIIPKGP